MTHTKDDCLDLSCQEHCEHVEWEHNICLLCDKQLDPTYKQNEDEDK